VAASDVPTVEEVAPYREALAVHEWEVLRVIEGELGRERVRVAHWAVLGGISQPDASLRLGVERRLDLEHMADNAQAAGVVLSDTLDPDAEVPLFLDVGP
jgi:hypothetical protein